MHALNHTELHLAEPRRDATLTPELRAHYSREAMLAVSRGERLRAAAEARTQNVAAWTAAANRRRWITRSFLVCGVNAFLSTALLLSAATWAKSDALWLAGVGFEVVAMIGFMVLCVWGRDCAAGTVEKGGAQ